MATLGGGGYVHAWTIYLRAYLVTIIHDVKPETLPHLLLGCVVARQVWECILGAWNCAGWRPSADTDLRLWWAGINGRRGVIKSYRMAVALVFWIIWCHMNDVVFNGASPSARKLLLNICDETTRWENAGLFGSGPSFAASLT
ncbi:hypothetical protein BRADI_4g32185v3, partial [Brachypodium distachyon]